MFGAERAKSLPDVPTMKELGYNVEYLSLGRLVRPQGHVRHRSSRMLRDDIKQGRAQPPVRDRADQSRAGPRLSRPGRSSRRSGTPTPSGSRKRCARSARWTGERLRAVDLAILLFDVRKRTAVSAPLPASSCERWGGGRGGGRAWLEVKDHENLDQRVPRARRLRRDMTDAERKLWWHLRRLPIEHSHFRRQATDRPLLR